MDFVFKCLCRSLAIGMSTYSKLSTLTMGRTNGTFLYLPSIFYKQHEKMESIRARQQEESCSVELCYAPCSVMVQVRHISPSFFRIMKIEIKICGSASKWKVGSGSASKWQAGSGSATKLCDSAPLHKTVQTKVFLSIFAWRLKDPDTVDPKILIRNYSMFIL